MRFGVNYTPSTGWFYSWLEPSWDDVRRDFDAIAALGLDHVRIFPLWPLLQPNRALIREQALDDVRTTVELAGRAGLSSAVDVIQGHLSSFDFLPSWMSTWHRRSMFTDTDAVEAQARLVEALHEALTGAPGFFALTMGNELNQFADQPHPSPMAAQPEDVTAWLGALLDAVPPGSPVARLHAEYDAAWYLDGHPFLPTHASRMGDMTAIHSWIFNGTAQHYGGMSQESLRHAEYLIELSRAFAVQPDRPIWLQEIGAPLNCLEEHQAADFCEHTVRHAADTAHLWGVTWWCSHDVSRSLADFPELEHTLGLFDEDGKPKPIGHRFASVAAEFAARRAPVPARSVAVEIPVDENDVPLRRGDLAPGGGVFTRWMELARSGDRPALVTSRHASDPTTLAGRGVLSVVQPAPGGQSVYAPVSES
ncbi:glycosyl hydrolase [Phytoactinopolyspora mesophila]|uniref:Glycosyl hydrolase n=1 Tax=Phytoactinopolyspora mesophila TaxID=2650750 RepID=A0A7K3M6V8_9ACTN|nr:glycosyl hydrolase [Phytoactinopolyspora mesophila]